VNAFSDEGSDSDEVGLSAAGKDMKAILSRHQKDEEESSEESNEDEDDDDDDDDDDEDDDDSAFEVIHSTAALQLNPLTPS